MAGFRRHPVLSALTAVLVAGLLAGGVAVVLIPDGDIGERGDVVLASRAGPPEADLPTTPAMVAVIGAPTSAAPGTTAPAAAPTTAARGTTAAPTSTAPTTTTTTGPPSSSVVIRTSEANLGAVPPEIVRVPSQPGQTLWFGISGGVAITLRSSPASPRAGEPVTFDIELNTGTEPCCGVWFVLGDGAIYAENNGWTCPSGGPQSPGVARYRTTHIYNLDGRWTFLLNPVTGNCNHAPVLSGIIGSIDIGSGTSAGQGPSRPSVSVDETVRPPGHESDRTWASVAGRAEDPDGWVGTLNLDWGDGTAPVAYGPGTTGCQVNPSGWPNPNSPWINTGDAIHHYAQPGRYTITLTAVSTACDGSTAQTTTDILTWRTDI